MDFSRTWKPFLGNMIFILAVSVAIALLFVLHVHEPATFNSADLIQISVGLGTGLLGLAAVFTLYFQAIDRIADRAPNLELTPLAVSKDEVRPLSRAPENYLWLDKETLMVEVINVGPGVAKDVWFFVVPRDKLERKSRWPLATPFRVEKIPVRRFLRVRQEATETSLRIPVPVAERQEGEKSALIGDGPFVVVVGCSDLDGRLGDVEVLGLGFEKSLNTLFLLSPTEAERVLWSLMTDVSRWVPKRMGFGLPSRRREA